MQDDYTSCRFHSPGAVLHCTTRYEGELKEFIEADEEAADLYEALIRDALTFGLPVYANAALRDLPSSECTYRTPTGLWAFLKRHVDPIPWLGEIRAYGSEAVDDNGPFWRGYFTDLRDRNEPDTEIDDVLLASIRMKGGEKGVKKGEQDRHITDAGDAIRKWCRNNTRFTFRLQSPHSGGD